MTSLELWLWPSVLCIFLEYESWHMAIIMYFLKSTVFRPHSSKSCYPSLVSYKGGWVLNGYFFQLVHCSQYMKHMSLIWMKHIQIKAIATFPIILEAHMNILSIIKEKNLLLIKWAYRSPLIVFTVVFEHVLLMCGLEATSNHISTQT